MAREALCRRHGRRRAASDAGVTIDEPASCRPTGDGPTRSARAALLHVSSRTRRAGRRPGVLVAGDRAGPGQHPRGSSRRPRPGAASAYGVYWPALVPADEIDQVVVLDDGRRMRIDPAPTGPVRRTPDRPADGRRRAAGRSSRHALGRTSAPAPATRAATPTSGSGPATTPATPGWRRPHRRAGPPSCSPRPPTSRSTATSCPTCGRSTSCSSATSARASPARPPFDPQAKGLGEYLPVRLGRRNARSAASGGRAGGSRGRAR